MGTPAAPDLTRQRRPYRAIAVTAVLTALVSVGLCLKTGLGARGADAAFRYSIAESVSPQAQAVYGRLAKMVSVASLVKKPPHTPEGFVAMREASLPGDEQRGMQSLQKSGATAQELKLGGVPVLDVRPAGYKEDGTLLIHIHGGGFVMGSARSTAGFAAMIATRMGKRVISIDYTLAPDARWQQVTDQAVAVYKALLDQGVPAASIGITGESAGGNIAAVCVLKARDQGLPLPGALVLLSPGLDLARKSETYKTLAAADPVLSDVDSIAVAFGMYAPESADRTNPYVSPVYADFSKGYPPLLLQVGTREIVLSDSVRLYQAVKLAGGSAQLDVYEGMPHVFQGYLNDTPEQTAAFDEMRRFFGAHLNHA